jgi:hypothetical protein
VASLFACGIIDDFIWPFATFPQVFERDWEWSAPVFHCEVTTTAPWIKQSGPEIYAIFEHGVVACSEYELRVLRSSREEFEGKEKLSLARWAFWRKKFEEWPGRDDLPSLVKEHVLGAMRVMDDISAHDYET